MPNHITNRLYIGILPNKDNRYLPAVIDEDISAVPATIVDIQSVRAFLRGTHGAEGDQTEIQEVDFNKILPMPAYYNQFVSGSCQFKGVQIIDYYAKTVDRGSVELLEKDAKGEIYTADGVYRALNEYAGKITLVRPQSKEEIQQCKDLGASSWYDWCCNNWGTKWNAYDIEVLDEQVLKFNTAWSGVTDLMTKLSEKFPSITFGYMYADEDTGSNTGIGTIKAGVASMVYPENGSREAYELAFELKPDCREYYTFEDGSYIPKEE